MDIRDYRKSIERLARARRTQTKAQESLALAHGVLRETDGEVEAAENELHLVIQDAINADDARNSQATPMKRDGEAMERRHDE